MCYYHAGRRQRIVLIEPGASSATSNGGGEAFPPITRKESGTIRGFAMDGKQCASIVLEEELVEEMGCEEEAKELETISFRKAYAVVCLKHQSNIIFSRLDHFLF